MFTPVLDETRSRHDEAVLPVLVYCEEHLQELGKHRASKGCLYITRLSGVDRGILTSLLERSLSEVRAGNS